MAVKVCGRAGTECSLGLAGFEDESPSKDTGRPPTAELQPLTARRPSTSPSKVAPTVSARINGEVSRRVFSRTPSFVQQADGGDASRASMRANPSFVGHRG